LDGNATDLRTLQMQLTAHSFLQEPKRPLKVVQKLSLEERKFVVDVAERIYIETAKKRKMRPRQQAEMRKTAVDCGLMRLTNERGIALQILRSYQPLYDLYDSLEERLVKRKLMRPRMSMRRYNARHRFWGFAIRHVPFVWCAICCVYGSLEDFMEVGFPSPYEVRAANIRRCVEEINSSFCGKNPPRYV